MRILFVPYSLLQVQLHKLLAENLKSRGHDVSFVDVSLYITYRTDHERKVYRESLGTAEYTLNTRFNFNVQSFFRVKQHIQALLHESVPDCVVVGLDSYPEQRVIVNLCRRFQIPTILIQDGLWIFRYGHNSWASIIYASIRQSASGLVRGRPKRVGNSIRNIVNYIVEFLFLQDIRVCFLGCGGCDRVGVFSDIVRDRLIVEGVKEDSIFVCGCLASNLNEPREIKSKSKVDKKSKHLVIISQPLYEVSVDLGGKIFTEIAIAIGRLKSLGWSVSIRLHPRETYDKWKEAFVKAGFQGNCNISHNVGWAFASVVIGFMSTLLADVMLDGIPLIIYDLEHPVVSQEDFAGIDGISVCRDSDEVVNKVILAESMPSEKLDKISCEVAVRFGLREDALERAIDIIEGIQDKENHKS